MENNTEKEFVIDLSNTSNTADLAIKLGLFLDSANRAENVILNLGDIDLKQSQLLSIRALIESMNSSIVSIMTTSAMTEASAISLGIPINSNIQVCSTNENSFHNSISEHIEQLNDSLNSNENINEQTYEENNENREENNNYQFVEEKEEENTNQETEHFEEKTIEHYEEAQPENTINNEVEKALDEVLGFQAESSLNVEVEPKKMEFDFEVSETKEQSSEGKYVLLDTDGITPEDYEENMENTSDLQTLYLTQTLRSGQRVSYEGNIFIVGDTHPGSEVIATGDVTVWGILGGIAHAGSSGNIEARVRALKLNPIQLRIAGLYSRRNDSINVPFIQKTNEFTPEEARIYNKQIMVYKTLRRED